MDIKSVSDCQFAIFLTFESKVLISKPTFIYDISSVRNQKLWKQVYFSVHKAKKCLDHSDEKFVETKVWIRALRDNRKVFCDLDNFDEFKIWNLAFLLSLDWLFNKIVFDSLSLHSNFSNGRISANSIWSKIYN